MAHPAHTAITGDGHGGYIEETYDGSGNLISRTHGTADGNTTNTARGTVGIQAKNVTGKTVRR